MPAGAACNNACAIPSAPPLRGRLLPGAARTTAPSAPPLLPHCPPPPCLPACLPPAVSKDHNCVLAACMDGCIRLLDRVEGDLLAEYRGAL